MLHSWYRSEKYCGIQCLIREIVNTLVLILCEKILLRQCLTTFCPCTSYFKISLYCLEIWSNTLFGCCRVWWWVLSVNMEIWDDSLLFFFHWTSPLVLCVYLAVWRFCWWVWAGWVQTRHCSLCWTLWSHPDRNSVERHHWSWYAFVIMLWQCANKGEQGWRSGLECSSSSNVACSIPALCHMWVKFVFDSCFALRGFPPFTKINISKFHFDQYKGPT